MLRNSPSFEVISLNIQRPLYSILFFVLLLLWMFRFWKQTNIQKVPSLLIWDQVPSSIKTSIWKEIIFWSLIPLFLIILLLGISWEQEKTTLHQNNKQENKQISLTFSVLHATREYNSDIHIFIRFQNQSFQKQQGILYCELSSETRSIPIILQSQEIQYKQLIFSNIENSDCHLWLHPTEQFLTIPIPARKKAKVCIVTQQSNMYILASLQANHQWVDLKNSKIQTTIPQKHNYDLILVCLPEWNFPKSKGKYIFFGTHLFPDTILENNPIAYHFSPQHILSKNLQEKNITITQHWKFPHQQISDHNIILHGKNAPLIWSDKNNEYIYVSFSLENTNWITLPSFPIFIQNILLWSLQKSNTKENIFIPKQEIKYTILPPIKTQPKHIQYWEKILIYTSIIWTIYLIVFILQKNFHKG